MFSLSGEQRFERLLLLKSNNSCSWERVRDLLIVIDTQQKKYTRTQWLLFITYCKDAIVNPCFKKNWIFKIPHPHIFEEKNQVGFYWFVYFYSLILFVGWLVVFVWGCYFLILWELFFFKMFCSCQIGFL